MNAIVQDVRFGLRTLGRRPVLTVVAVATLALGIGGATATFSVADAVILRPLPFAEPDRLVLVCDRSDPVSRALARARPRVLGRGHPVRG